MLFLGVAAVLTLLETLGKLRRIAVPVAFGVLLTTGVVLGVIALEGAAETTIAVVLAFGAAALLYLVTEKLLVKGGTVPQTPVSTTLFFVGFLAIFLLDIVG